MDGRSLMGVIRLRSEQKLTTSKTYHSLKKISLKQMGTMVGLAFLFLPHSFALFSIGCADETMFWAQDAKLSIDL
jgi:hypothetical protein